MNAISGVPKNEDAEAERFTHRGTRENRQKTKFGNVGHNGAANQDEKESPHRPMPDRHQPQCSK